MFTAAFLKASAERAVKTFAQTLLAVLVVGSSLTDIDWVDVLSVSAVATLASLLTSIVSSGIGGPGPSLGTEKLAPVVDDDQRVRYVDAGDAVDLPPGVARGEYQGRHEGPAA